MLLADTKSLDTFHATSTIPTENGNSVENTQPSRNILRSECLQLLKEAEALRILMLEFELTIRADLH